MDDPDNGQDHKDFKSFCVIILVELMQDIRQNLIRQALSRKTRRKKRSVLNGSAFKRMRGGLKAKRSGSEFEGLFEKLCRLQGIAVTSIPDGCKQIGPNPLKDLVRVKTPFDWVVTYQGKTVMVDTKSVEGKSFSCSAIVEHQVEALDKHERAGGRGGYLIWLKESGQVFFMRGTVLFSLMQRRGSFSETHPEAIPLGSAYSFDIKKIFQDLTNGANQPHTLVSG